MKKKCLFFFVSYVINFSAQVTWPGTQPHKRSISVKFLLKTRLESVSFETLIGFLVFLVQKLWSKTTN